MKGLLYKDFYVLFKQYKLILTMLAVLALVNSEFTQGMLAIFLIMVPLYTFACDEQCRWEAYAVMMPYTKKAMVQSKYVLFLLIAATLAALELISAAAYYLIKGDPQGTFLNDKVCWPLAILLVALIAVSLIMPFIFKLGVEKGRMAYLAAIAITGGFIGAYAKLADVNADFFVRFLNAKTLMPMLAVIAAAAVAISIKASIRIYENKEF